MSVAFRAIKILTTLRADVPVAIRTTKNLEDIMIPVGYRCWKRSFLELSKSFQQLELTFLSIIAFGVTKILSTVGVLTFTIDAILLLSVQLITLFKINVQHISFILLITRTPLERWLSSESVSGKDLLLNKRTRSCDVGLSVTSSDEISFGSST